jgi:DNA-directed RNA polymerase specialized sigma24 family protein
LPLQLHDIDDAERFVGAIVSRSGFSLSFHDREALGEYLLVECWQLSLRYQAGGISFSTWAGNTLRRRSVDWVRQRNGRTVWRFGDGRVHARQLPSFVPLDGLDDALGAGSGDPADSGDSDLGRVATTGDRQRLGISGRSVSRLLDELRDELERLS